MCVNCAANIASTFPLHTLLMEKQYQQAAEYLQNTGLGEKFKPFFGMT